MKTAIKKAGLGIEGNSVGAYAEKSLFGFHSTTPERAVKREKEWRLRAKGGYGHEKISPATVADFGGVSADRRLYLV
jgi:hypothetical protein